MRGCAWVLTFLMFLAPGAGIRGDDENRSFREVVQVHVERHPLMEVQDLYKLVFQAAMGSEHAVPDPESARQWLERELSNLSGGTPEPLTEPLSPDGALVRVNLRAFIQQDGEVDLLLAAFVATAARHEGSKDRLRSYWSDVEAMAGEGALAFDLDQLREFFSDMQSRGFPAVHHSPQYRDTYHPAYRVVLIELLPLSTPD